LVSVLEALTVKVAATRLEARAMVPAIVSVANCWPVPSVIVWSDPVNVTEELVGVPLTVEEVSHEPAIETVEESKRRVAGPTAARFPAKTTVAPVSISVADHATFEAKVVLTPGSTVSPEMTWGIRMDPPDAFTTTVDAPGVNVPAEVSTDLTVIVLPLAVRTPRLATFNAPALRGRFEPDVLRVVVPEPPRMVIELAIRPRAAIVNVTVDEPLLNTTALNSLPRRLAPAKVIVCAELESKVTVPDPATQAAEVELFVQLPKTVQASEPNAMYEEFEETSTSPPIATVPEVETRYPPVRVRLPFTVRV
jgi:hypothetical protein